MTKREAIIEFYETKIKDEKMSNADELNDEQLEYIGGSLSFARWMLRYHYDEVILAIKSAININ